MPTIEVSVEKVLDACRKKFRNPENALDGVIDICRDCGLCEVTTSTIIDPETIRVKGKMAGKEPECDLVGMGLLLDEKVSASVLERHIEIIINKKLFGIPVSLDEENTLATYMTTRTSQLG